ncbi:ATP-binding protein [Roseibium salinum]
MLLTCQCKRVELENGEAAALIVCGDKGLSTTKDPVSGFAHFLQGDGSTVFVTTNGVVEEQLGALQAPPENPDLPEDQKALFGPLEAGGSFHEGVALQIGPGQKLIVLEDASLPEDTETLNETGRESVADGEDDFAAGALYGEITGVPYDAEAGSAGEAEPEAGLEDAAEADAGPDAQDSEEAPDEASLWVRADEAEPDEERAESRHEELHTPDEAALVEDDETVEDLTAEPEDIPEDEETAAAAANEEPETGETDQEPVAAEAASETDAEDTGETDATGDGEAEAEDEGEVEAVADEADGALAPEDAGAPADAETATEETAAEEPATQAGEGFVFQPRRRPIRFAWKMDIDQRFTFLSDEFSDVMGPETTDIVGQTWEEVAERFGLDARGLIARALDRRDTWSGKTVDWPVTGAPLRVPVDMAALPAFDRNRKFEGYRGFGVCRTADAVEDKENLLSPALAAFDEAFAATPVADDEEADSGAEDLAAAVEDAEHEPAEETAGPQDDTNIAAEAPDPVAEDEADTEEDAGAEETVSEESASEEVGAEESVTEDTAAPEEIAATAEEQPEAEDVRQEAPVEAKETIADLKPAQPDTFSGRTFLGASAAALVGSLAKFTSKSPAKTPQIRKQPEEPEQPAETAQSDDAGNQTDREAGTAPTPMDDERTEDLTAAEEETTFEADADAPLEETGPAPDEPSMEDEQEDDGQAEAEEELTGISGPAPLKPAEIESAVKTLAKSYKAVEVKPRDLFDAEQAASGEAPPVPGLEEAAAEADEADEAAATEAVDVDAGEAETGDEVKDEEFEPVPSFEETHFDIVEEDGRALEEVAAGLDRQDDDEREFFEETAAFEAEENLASEPEAQDDDSIDAAPEKPSGKIIPLATARPRVVPVDTSGLSRPERQAFRKIAEALGARLEGDLEDFDAPDAVEELEDLPPEEPEAGPIDPSLLDRLPIGIAIVHDREVLYANKALLRMLGYKSIAKLSEAGGLEALFIDDAEELPDAVGMDGEVDETMKVRMSDGGVLSVDAHMHAVPWNGSHGLMISITERTGKQAAGNAEPASPNFFAEIRSELDSARNQIAEMDTILETATDGVLVLDQQGCILKVNGSAEALFSASRSDMIGAPLSEFLAPESHRAAADYLDGLTRNGVASILNDGREVLGKNPTGGLIPLFMTIGRITNARDDAKYCAVLRDITQWKTAEEELTQAKRQAENASSQKSDFLAKISHEIRTPLNAIIGFSEVMMEERFGPIGNERYKDYLKDIRTSGSHIMSLINDLLDLSKIEAGKLDLKFSAVSTNDVINECVALMQPQANRERVIIRASLPESVPDVVADARSLRQIVLNLLSNAIKYNKSGGQVILSTALESNGEVALRVRDTGTGMTTKQLAAALEPFRQLHTASRGGGTGLGLPLTKALVEANRASFHIDSTPDQGTLVEIIFPTQRVLSE